MRNDILIEQMVDRVISGHKPTKVWETSLSLHPGSGARAVRDTVAIEYKTNTQIPVSEGTVVTISGIGSGSSGVDHFVRLPDGRQATIPFADLTPHGRYESAIERRYHPIEEDLTGAVVKVTLSKPLPQSATDWLEGAYVDHQVQLPSTPTDDSATSMSFYMKAADNDLLQAAVEALKKLAGTSFKNSVPATLTDWSSIGLSG